MSYDVEEIKLKEIISTFKSKVKRLRGLMRYMPGLLHGTVEMMDVLILKYENEQIIDINEFHDIIRSVDEKN